MRLSHLFSVVATVLLLPGVGAAEGSADSTNTLGPDAVQAAPANAEGDKLAWDQFDDPEFAPGAGGPVPPKKAEDPGVVPSTEDAVIPVAAAVAVPSAPATRSGVVLGPVGIDDQGRSGRLHTVAKGDTLWDLSAAYLGTPWVWPSVWIDNDDIKNPHLILPNDKIWITANEMRVVSDAEAESFLAPIVEETMAAAAMDMEADTLPPLAAFESDQDDSSTLDSFPVEIPDQVAGSLDSSRQITVASREMMGFVTAETLEGASSIVDSSSERTFLAAGDPVYLGMGEGDAEVGDQFSIFRVVDEVRDYDTNRILGHHVEALGWLEVEELTGDTSIGMIRQSFDEIQRGSKVVPREKISRHVTVLNTPDAIEGQIVFLPQRRALMADGGYVYLNRGEFHGIEIGSELEVFDAGFTVNERERRVDVRTPDASAATLVVVSVEADSSVAFVLNSKRELAVGDHVRPVGSRMASR